MDGGSNMTSEPRTSRKRTHAAMTTDAQRSSSPAFHSSHSLPLDDHYFNEHRRQRRREQYILPPLDSTRFEGDLQRHGFDYRRPVMSRRSPSPVAAETIDLTSDGPAQEEESASRVQRLPRYGRDIIDISSETGQSRQRPSILRPVVHRTASGLSIRRQESPLFVQDDEIEFVSSRPLSRNVSVMPGAADSHNGNIVDLTDDQDDDIVITSERPATTGVNAHDPVLSATVGVRRPHSLLEGLSALMHQSTRLYDRLVQYHQIPPQSLESTNRQRIASQGLLSSSAQQLAGAINGAAAAHERRTNLPRLPVNLDFAAVAFPFGARTVTPEVRYDAPAPPDPGFTRSPKDDEEVVCPNCGAELAVEGDETQREVWVVRKCGHAYCGKCVRRRLETMSRRGGQSRDKQRDDEPSILRKCVIDQQPITKAAITHVFLGG